MHTEELLADLEVERNGVPLYVQIREQVLRALRAGRLAPGDRMPTMRQMAVALKIDLNTVRHAYEALARTGAITLIHGSGSFVREIPAVADDALDRLARDTLNAARAAGLAPAALASRILDLASTPPAKDETP